MTIQARLTDYASRLGLVLVLVTVAVFNAAHANAAGAGATAEQRIGRVKADLKSTDPLVRQSAIGSLVHSDISPKLLAEMRTALDDHDGGVRATAATAIGNVGAAAIPAIGQLVAQLKNDSVKEARETAARALGRIGKAAPDEKGIIDPLRAATRDDADPVTRVVAHGALAMMNVEMEEQIISIRKYLHHDEALVRMKASHALGMIGKPARAAAPEIVEVLKLESDGHRRGYVARALGSTGDPASLPALEAALEKETDPGARGEMRGAISRLKAAGTEKVKP
jgi:HEAT repeat protein